jgi:hypothetical protein
MEKELRELYKEFVEEYLTIKVSFYDTDETTEGFVTCEMLPFVPAVGDVIRLGYGMNTYIVTKRVIDLSERVYDKINYNVIVKEIKDEDDEEV